MVPQGEVEFVARHGEFIPLAACLVERRLRWAQRSASSGGSPWAEMPDDVAEIFRQEINNPLTGILGNAERMLSHGLRLPPADTQHLQTVVDLAVRLRATIRRLSDAWDSQTRLPKSPASRSALRWTDELLLRALLLPRGCCCAGVFQQCIEIFARKKLSGQDYP